MPKQSLVQTWLAAISHIQPERFGQIGNMPLSDIGCAAAQQSEEIVLFGAKGEIGRSVMVAVVQIQMQLVVLTAFACTP